MGRKLGLVAFFAVMVVLPVAAQAQRGFGRYANTPPMTPYGPAIDPVLWRQAGGNPEMYDQLLQRKMMFMQQQVMQKQQRQMQLMQKAQKAQKKNGQNDPAAAALTQGTQRPFIAASAARKKHGKKTTAVIEEQTEPKTKSAKDAKGKTTSKPTTPATSTPATTTTPDSGTSTTTNPPAGAAATTESSAQPKG
jgi:hypothetical protein